MRWLHERPVRTTLLAFALAAGAVLAIAAAWGVSAFARPWTHAHLGWLALAGGAELLAIPAYALAYRALARADDGPKLARPLVLRVVTAGFGPHAVYGGFELDRRALCAVDHNEHAATVRVVGLGALEWALLAPAACLAAIALLATDDPRPMPSVLWPWVVAVPLGFGVGLWLSRPAQTRRICARRGKVWAGLGKTLMGVGILHSLARSRRVGAVAWTGMACYWALDIAAFYGALRFIGVQPNLGETIIAYATGYALTRRSMPFGGAGVTEALMTFSLYWVGQPVASALAAVVVYRVFNFAVPGVLALLVRRRVEPLLAAAEEGRVSTRTERRWAAAPLARLRLRRAGRRRAAAEH